MLRLGKAGRYDEGMKTIARSIFIGLVCGAAAICTGAIPSINVTVLESSGNDSSVGKVSTSSMQNPATGH